MLTNSLAGFALRGLTGGFRDWRTFRRVYGTLSRLFSDGVSMADEKPHSNIWIVEQVATAVREHAIGIVFFERELTGLLAHERNDSFWSLRPNLATDFGPATEEDLVHYLRYKQMSRIEVYHVIGDQSFLIGGASHKRAAEIGALRSFLSSPRTLNVRSPNGTASCVFSVDVAPRFEVYPILIVDIGYRSGKVGFGASKRARSGY